MKIENKKLSELTVGEFMELTESIIYKAIIIYEENKEKPDMISLREGGKLVGVTRLNKMIEMGLINPMSSGNGKNATKRISRAKLLSMNNYHL